MPKWTKSDVRLLRKLYPKKQAKEIVKKVGRNEDAVFEKALRLGLRKRPDPRRWLKKTIPPYPRVDSSKDRRKKLTDQEKEEIRAAHKLGMGLTRLAREYGVSISTIQCTVNLEYYKRILRANAIRNREYRKNPEYRKMLQKLQDRARRERLRTDPEYRKWVKETDTMRHMQNYARKKGN